MPETAQKLDSKPGATPEYSDKELAQRIRNSDEQAFKSLYYRYYELLFKYIWRRVQNNETAKDLAQILFIRVWNSRHRLDSNLTIKAYLYQIATNLVIDHFRQKGHSQLQFLEEFETEPHEELDDRFELEEVIDQAVNNLPEPLQIVFKLSRFKDLKNNEIADKLNISVKTVESRMTKAFTILREQLKPLLLAVLFFRIYFKL